MASEPALNARAAAFYPPAASHTLHTDAGASTRPAQSQSRKKSIKKKPTNGASASQQSQAETLGGGGSSSGNHGTAEALVPASVRRRRKPASKSSKPHARSANGTTVAQDGHDGDGDGQEEADCCLLCTDVIEFHAVGSCNHHGICSKCAMRMRLLMNDRNCAICKQPLERVIVSATARAFESFTVWGDAAGLDSVLDEASDMLFYECRAHYRTLHALRENKCRMRKCNVVCGSTDKLKDHLRIEHGTEFCELCLTHQHFFLQEHQVFTKNGLRMHNVGHNRTTGLNASSKDFHPMCQFCRRRFYADMQLYQHLERDHFRCHLCKHDHEYFRNYASLETHFRCNHFLCEEAVCRGNHFIVFADDIEFNAHMRSVHGVTNRLTLNFQVARTGENPLGGSASYEPNGGEIPDRWNFETVEPTVDQRSQLESAFPALPTASTPPPPPSSQPAIAPRATAMRRTSSATGGFAARIGGVLHGGPSASAGPPAAPRGHVLRNQRLATALGLAPPGQSTEAFEQEMKTPNYPTHLIEWGKANVGYLQVVERRLERIVKDASCHSVSLRPMPGEERALMHGLAELYGIPSQSFGEDPFRRISFFKNEAATVPAITLSTFIQNMNRRPGAAATGAAGRLSFLPLRGQAPAAAPRPVVPVARPKNGISRGWEKIEPKRRPVIVDAWSDDEDQDEDAQEKDGSKTVEGETSETDDTATSTTPQRTQPQPVSSVIFDDEEEED